MTQISSDRIASIEARKQELANLMSAPNLSPDEFVRLSKDYAAIEPVAAAAREVRRLRAELEVLNGMLHDASAEAELKEMAAAEAEEIRHKLPQAERALAIKLLPRDAADDRAAMLEVRAGTGGDEAALFAADLYRMYTRFCERQGWRVETMSYSDGTLGGIREVIFKVSGSGAYGSMRWESGVHRVQRVPRTESQGRIHTSAATVAVLPEAEAVDVKIEDKDIRIDVFRSSGPGGQSVNTTDSAVRITHLPTGLVVSQQDQKSQLQNKLKAMEVLRARLLGLRIQQQQDERAKMRRSQVGGGDRSEKIRTYNYPQSRVTDHRIGWTTHDLQGFIDGDIGPPDRKHIRC